VHLVVQRERVVAPAPVVADARMAMPLAIRPQRPARCRAAACEMGSIRSWSIFCRGE